MVVVVVVVVVNTFIAFSIAITSTESLVDLCAPFICWRIQLLC